MADPERADDDSRDERWPVGFILLIVAAAAYLLLRFVQMGAWLIDRLFG